MTKYPIPQDIADELGGQEEAMAFVASLGYDREAAEEAIALADAEPELDVNGLHARLAIVHDIHMGPATIAYILQQSGR